VRPYETLLSRLRHSAMHVKKRSQQRQQIVRGMGFQPPCNGLAADLKYFCRFLAAGAEVFKAHAPRSKSAWCFAIQQYFNIPVPRIGRDAGKDGFHCFFATLEHLQESAVEIEEHAGDVSGAVFATRGRQNFVQRGLREIAVRIADIEELAHMFISGWDSSWPGHRSFAQTLGVIASKDRIVAYGFDPIAVGAIPTISNL